MDAALLRACSVGSLADVLDCLANGACATAVDVEGASALHLATRRRDARIAEALVRSGAPVNARSRFHATTPLHWVSGSDWATGSAACCALLLSAGADVDVADDAGITPLHNAAYFGVVDCAVQLLAAGADLGARDCWGHTAADVAAQESHVAMASLLRDAAAARARWSGLRRAALTVWCSPWH